MEKKYANILMQRSDIAELVVALKACAELTQISEYKEVLQSKLVSKSSKVSFVIELLKSAQIKVSEPFVNLLKLLASDAKLNILGKIYPEILRQEEMSRGICQGVIYTKSTLTDADLRRYSEKLSAKLGKQISLVNKISENDEVKIVLDDLGYEIVLSNEIIKKSIKEFIIKAI